MKVAVIGAGPAGCTAAHALRQLQHDVTLYEQEAFVGGRTRTLRDGEAIVDSGAGFVSRTSTAVLRLSKQLDVRWIATRAPRAVLVSTEGRYITRLDSGLGVLRYPWMTARDKLRLIWQLARTAWGWRRLDLFDPASLAAVDDASIAGYAIAALGSRVYEHFIRAMIESLWFFRCEDASRALLLGILAQAPRSQILACPTGMDSLCRALTQDIRVRDRASVLAIASRDGGPCVRTHDDEAAFDRIVVATTAPVAAHITRTTPWVSDAARTFLATRRYASNLHVVYRLGAPLASPVQAAMPVGPGERQIVMVSLRGADGSGFVPSASGAELVSIYASDAGTRALEGSDDAKSAAALWAQGRELMPSLPHEPANAIVIRRPEAIPIPEVSSFAHAVDFVSMQQPPIVFCGDYLSVATVEGAVRSGLAAAQRISIS
jgi:oxygen-dependent protoporphyrinogen oxidase